MIGGGALAVAGVGTMLARPAMGGGMHDPYFSALAKALREAERAAIAYQEAQSPENAARAALLAAETAWQARQVHGCETCTTVPAIPFGRQHSSLELERGARGQFVVLVLQRRSVGQLPLQRIVGREHARRALDRAVRQHRTDAAPERRQGEEELEGVA